MAPWKARPTTSPGWGSPIATITDAETEETVALDATSTSQFYLLWITELTEGEGGFVVEIGEIELTA